jgi:aspartyl/asparaginyl beta-hydroxylase (cupin superfamily)
LGLIVPPESSGKCEIRVADEWRRWEAGKAIVFDDSFEHEVVNYTNLPRMILLIRFWHPDFDSPASMRSALCEAVDLKEVRTVANDRGLL